MEINKTNILIVVALIAFVALGTYFFLQIKAGQQEKLYESVFTCGAQQTVFRAKISDCDKIPVSPDEQTLTNTLTSPLSEGVVILLDPDSPGKAGTAVAARDIYKIFDALKTKTGKKVGIALTAEWPNQTFPVMSIGNATFKVPIIWLRPNQTKTLIRADGARIYVDAINQKDLDAAACKISILTIKRTLNC